MACKALSCSTLGVSSTRRSHIIPPRLADDHMRSRTQACAAHALPRKSLYISAASCCTGRSNASSCRAREWARGRRRSAQRKRARRAQPRRAHAGQRAPRKKAPGVPRVARCCCCMCFRRRARVSADTTAGTAERAVRWHSIADRHAAARRSRDAVTGRAVGADDARRSCIIGNGRA